MQNLKNCPKHLIILMVLFLRAISVQAQQSNAVLTNTASTQNAIATSSVMPSKSVKTFYANGDVKIMKALPTNNGQQVAASSKYFVINNTGSDKNVIKLVDVNANTTTDAVKVADLNSGTPTDKKIVEMIYDAVADRLYFSTVSVNANGTESYLTWYYNPATSDVKIFADGKLKKVDNTGAVESEMHGADAKGQFIQSHVNKIDGTPVMMGTRAYTSQTINSSN